MKHISATVRVWLIAALSLILLIATDPWQPPGVAHAAYSDLEACVVSPGDFSGDNAVNVLDVVGLVSFVLGVTPDHPILSLSAACAPCYEAVTGDSGPVPAELTDCSALPGDVTGDGSLNVLDVVQTVSAILGVLINDYFSQPSICEACYEAASGSVCAATDSTCDDVDDDCDGFMNEDYVNVASSCGVGACAAVGEILCDQGHTVDTCEPGIPAAFDATCDGHDSDCSGEADEDYQPITTYCGVGACAATGVTTCIDAVEGDTCLPGSPLSDEDSTCDGVDDDCDGLTDEDYAGTPISCGQGVCAVSTLTSCVDGEEISHCEPGAPTGDDDDCDDEDEDCDGEMNEHYMPPATTCGVGACGGSGELLCVSGAILDTCSVGMETADQDMTCNGVDDDCDGDIDEDYIPFPASCGLGVCEANGTILCIEGEAINTCTPGPSQGIDANCDGEDDDCDGVADDDFYGLMTTCGLGACAATGTTVCTDGVIWDSCLAGTPAGTDSNCDNVDNNCNGAIDEGFEGWPTECGIDACGSYGEMTCVEGTLVDTCETPIVAPQDDSCNGQDDDCDGLIDEDYGGDDGFTLTTCGVGACGRHGYGICAMGFVVDSCVPGLPTDDNDSTCDGEDDDCDGLVDENWVGSLISCGEGACLAVGTTICVDGEASPLCNPADPIGPDVHCDGVDEDCDGDTDEACYDACGSGTGSCYENQMQPGCQDVACCETTCAQDHFCCHVAWDTYCGDIAAESCGSSVCLGAEGACDSAHPSSGCEDIECCEDVCSVDPACCDFHWDTLCAEIAGDVCVADIDCCAPHAHAGCADASCMTQVCATLPQCCDEAWTAQCAEAAATLCSQCSGSCCSARDESGCGDETCEATICADDPFCCDWGWDADCATAATDQCVACGGYGQWACPTSGACDSVHGARGCEDADCCVSVCEAMPDCCHIQWESECVDAANEICDVGDGPPDEWEVCATQESPCNSAHGLSGCSDTTCCQSVCDVDAACCELSWDALCVSQGAELCGFTTTTPDTSTGDCCEANDSPGCNDPECEDLVCQAAGICCISTWSALCANFASFYCSGCSDE